MSQHLIRCRCGVWTNYGLACINCRSSTPLPHDDDAPIDGEKEEPKEDEEEDDESS